MRFSIAVLFVFVASASAVYSPIHRRQLPDCSESCLANADLNGCSVGDDTCLCKSQAFVQSTFSCIQAACQGNDLQQAIEGAEQLCLAVGITLSTTTAASTASGSSGSSSSSVAPVSSGSSSATATTNTDSGSSSVASPSATSPSATAPTTTTSGSSNPSNAALSSAPGVQHAFAGLAALALIALVL